ncbi:transcription termination factor 3, mitochondrial isoform X2 [Myripristis murdjan]|uniref:Transcription termination factor 3, mitochondrial n=2 Tax=Myripristis murdjan TaxID=586833 RepID=A0A667X3N6_9TELE|nr:transcription termination factor 3, mitochondrial isoform X2 [Myripristis murdjan]
MASSCIQLCCRRCSGLLRSKITVQYSTQAQHCTAVLTASSRVSNGSSFLAGICAASHTRQRWRQQMCFYSEHKAKPLTAEANRYKDAEELSGSDVVAYKNRLQNATDSLPVTDSQVTLDVDAAKSLSALEEISDEEAVSISVPSALPPATTSLRDYVDKSETLSKLVQLGVNLWKLEQRPNVGSMLLKLDFQTDVAPRLLFLKDIGVEDSRLGYILSTNPFILSEDLENLRTRVNYLRSMKFSSETVASMVSRAPYLLNFSVKRLDNRLAFYQQQLGLSTWKTRDVVARLPRLLCGSLEPVKENLKVCQIELGFKENEIQHIVVTVPKVLTANKKKLTQIFDYLHNTMKLPHHLIVKFPQVLNAKYLRIKERHLFLQYLGKAQYDPTQPSYVSLDRLVTLPDDTFCTDVASATLQDFHLFLKTL